MDLREEFTLFIDEVIDDLEIKKGYSIINFTENETIFYTKCNQVGLSAREYLTTLLSINDKIIWYDFKSGDIGCSLLEVVNAKTLKTIMDNKSDNNIQNYCSKENCYNLYDYI
ncbi:MAG: hypothetical protein HRU35_04415 [Rickettsiaceae bacterium]|nr:hypothetical protein [Rickettsiaceae bacterium]